MKIGYFELKILWQNNIKMIIQETVALLAFKPRAKLKNLFSAIN
jgi:hypothetical protein